MPDSFDARTIGSGLSDPEGIKVLAAMASDCRDYILDRMPAGAPVTPIRLEIDDSEWIRADAWPRQIARVVDASVRSEWVIDLRRFGDRLQIRAVEYAVDGMWMPHVWRDLPRGAAVFFQPGEGLQIRHDGPRPVRLHSAS